jgi:TPR repeat protein
MKKSLLLMLVFLLMCIVTAPGFAEPLEEQSVELVRKAAEQGNADAQTKLGTMYYEGKGVPQDYIQAHRWFNLAASSGDKVSAEAAEDRELAASKMTPQQIAEAQRLANEWFNKKKETK